MDSKAEARITRRSFCNRALLTSAGLALAANEVGNAKAEQIQSTLVYPPMKVEGAERVIAGSYLYFEYPTPRDAAVLMRSVEGEYLAYSRKCAHRGCSVDYDQAQKCLRCPCHRGVYDSRTGYVMYGPPPRPLDQIILQMRAGGEVWAVGKRSGGDATVPVTAGLPQTKQSGGTNS